MYQPNDAAGQMRRNLRRGAVAAACLFGLVLAAGFYSRHVDAEDLKSWTGETRIPTVALISPEASGKSRPLILPGTLEAFYDAKLHARVPGYVKAWYKDIGASVKKGDVLAVIDTPELDQQIAQVKADLGAARAAEKVADATARRWDSLLPIDAVSKQDVEEKDADLAAKAGAAKAAAANLERLQAMKGFARITAPFDGVVTRRTADIGALVNAGSPGGSEPLFAVADMHALRLYVNVPQSYSAEIVPGMRVTLTVPEYPGRVFPAKLVSTARAISAGSSTLLVEFEADNPQGLLKPGEFAQVTMALPSGGALLALPVGALMFRAAGLQVATVNASNRVVMKPITLATDLGTKVIVASGLSPHDRVVDNPPDSLGNGDEVRIERTADAD